MAGTKVNKVKMGKKIFSYKKQNLQYNTIQND